jgi:hypothetical protein
MPIEAFTEQPSQSNVMTKRLNKLEDYISAGDAARLLSKKFGRRIDPDYIRKLKNVRFHTVGSRSKLYNRDDILACTVKQKKTPIE